MKKKTTTANTTYSQNVSVLRAFNRIKKQTLRGKEVLLDCKIEPTPRGATKIWEIRLRFFHSSFRIAGFMIGKALSGSFTCHRIGDFVTYCVTVRGRDYWFDQYPLAIQALSNETLLFEEATPHRVNC